MLKLVPVFFLIFLSFSGKTQINMVVKQGGFLFLEGKDSIFFYQRSPKDKNGEYSRCNYIHPLYGLDGTRLTEDFPADHLHHRGVFWAWHQVIIDNKQVSDGWELKNFQQKVTNFEFLLQKGIGIVNTTVEWKSPLWENGSEAYLKEDVKIKIHTKTGSFRRIDFEIQMKALTDRLTIAGSDDEKGYGGFFARLKLPVDVKFSSTNGLVEPVVAAVKAGNFMNINGAFLNGGEKGGIVVWSDPSNPEPSNNWILRKTGSIQNVAFPGRNPLSIPYGEPLILKYSLLVFQGDMSQKQITKAVKK